MITHYHLSWKPQENITISFSDETSEKRSIEQIDAFFEALRETAGTHGFDIQHWGDDDQMIGWLERHMIGLAG